MTGEKRTETRMRCYNTMCVPYISLHPSLHALYMIVGRVVEWYIGNTQCYSISFLFLFFFHQSSLYPNKIFVKCFNWGEQSEPHIDGTSAIFSIGKCGSTSYIGMTQKKMAANRKGIGPTTLKRACNSTTNTRTKYLLIVMHKTLCSVWLIFIQRENETVQNCLIVLKNSSS